MAPETEEKHKSLKNARESKGYDVVSVDGSKEMCRLAEKYIGRDVRNITFAELDYNNEFDAVWARACLKNKNCTNQMLHFPFS